MTSQPASSHHHPLNNIVLIGRTVRYLGADPATALRLREISTTFRDAVENYCPEFWHALSSSVHEESLNWWHDTPYRAKFHQDPPDFKNNCHRLLQKVCTAVRGSARHSASWHAVSLVFLRSMLRQGRLVPDLVRVFASPKYQDPSSSSSNDDDDSGGVLGLFNHGCHMHMPMLSLACLWNQLAVVNLLLSCNSEDAQDEKTPSSHPSALRCDVNGSFLTYHDRGFECRPMFMAIEGGTFLPIVDTLLKHGCTTHLLPNVYDKKDNSSSSSSDDGSGRCAMSSVLSHVCSYSESRRPDTPAVAKLLLQHGADVESQLDVFQSPLIRCIVFCSDEPNSTSRPNIETARVLLDIGKADVNRCDVNAGLEPPLSYAINVGTCVVVEEDKNCTTGGAAAYIDLIRLLIDHGADVNACSSSDERFSMLALACISTTQSPTQLEIIRLLLKCGARGDLTSTLTGESALFAAARRGNARVCDLLLRECATCDINQPIAPTPSNGRSSILGWTPICMATYGGHVETVRILMNWSRAGGDDDGHDRNPTRWCDQTVPQPAPAAGFLSPQPTTLRGLGMHYQPQKRAHWDALWPEEARAEEEQRAKLNNKPVRQQGPRANKTKREGGSNKKMSSSASRPRNHVTPHDDDDDDHDGASASAAPGVVQRATGEATGFGSEFGFFDEE